MQGTAKLVITDLPYQARPSKDDGTDWLAHWMSIQQQLIDPHLPEAAWCFCASSQAAFCLGAVRTCGGPATSEARVRPSMSRSSTKP